MSHKCTIAGEEVSLSWNQETAKRYEFRIGTIGGEPTRKELTSPKTAGSALFKVLWALIPAHMLAKYPDPESLFVATDHEKEAEGVFNAIKGVFLDRVPSSEKKTTSENSLSPE